eukprot:UN32639
MNFIVGFLLKHMENEEEIFWLLVQIFKKTSPLFAKSMINLRETMENTDRLIKLYIPDLWAYFEEQSISSALFLPIWYQSLFLHPSLPLAMSLRIWDLLILFD